MFIEANNERNKFSVCRFGNVTHSHGSVLPFWLRLKANNETLKLTDSRMNRLMFSQKEAVDLVHKTMQWTRKGDGGFILSKKMKTVNMLELAKVISDDVGSQSDSIALTNDTIINNNISVSDSLGEKLDETLISTNELPYSHCIGDFIKITEEENTSRIDILTEEYSSLTAKKMNVDEMIDMVAETDKNLKKSLFKYGIYG